MWNWLMNNILVFTLIIVAIVLIAVGLVLYFTIFRKKLKARAVVKKEQKQKDVASREQSKNYASNVFEEKQKAKQGPSKEELKEFDEKLKTMVNENKKSAINSRNFQNQIDNKSKD